MPNPIKGMLKRLAKWIVKHGSEELEKEAARRIGGGERPTAGS